MSIIDQSRRKFETRIKEYKKSIRETFVLLLLFGYILYYNHDSDPDNCNKEHNLIPFEKLEI